MSSIVQLKRSALSGKVPGTGSLNLGELALNTYDGKIFFRRSGSTDTIQEVVTTNVLNTGSVTITGTLTAGSIVGSISASNGVVSGSSQIVGILSSLNSYTASYATTGSNQFTADQNITGSLRATLTGSFGSLKVNDTLTINHGEAIISGSALVTSDLTILGAVNARQFNISVISSSVLFESGSSRFGNTLDDTHSFTGSVNITGSFLLNGQEVGGGTTTGSFTGSFIGDGSGLRGVVSDDLPIDGWDYNSNSSASISEFNNESRKYLIDFQWDSEVGTPIGFKTFISNVTGSSQIVPTEAGIKFIVGNQQVALVGPNGIESVPPAGTISGSSQVTYVDITSIPSGIVSGSSQITYASISSIPSGIVSGSSQLTSSVLATTGSNTFRGTQTLSGSIIPAIDNAYDLGSATYQWRDIYVSSGSLYIDGTKVLGSTGNELQITTDVGQSIKILEAGSDSIILQSADGDIQLKTSGGGNLLFDPTSGLIDVRGTLQIQDGNKITSSGGNSIQFGNDLGITGSINTTGNINGVNLTTFSSSVASTLLNQNTATSSYETKGRGIVSGSSQITFSGISSLPTLVSGSSQIIYTSISSIPSGIVSGSIQTIANLPTGVVSGSSQILAGSGIVSSSSQVDVMSTTNIARLATTGSNTFFGTQTFSGSVYIANDLIVQGSSSIQYISASSVNIGTNIVQLNTANPSVRFAGLTIIDSGSVGGSGSFLYDSVQDEFIFVHRGNGTNVTSSHFVLGPETYDSLGNETYLTTNKLPKGTGKEHLNDSNIIDTGTLITLGSNTSVTGILTATGFSGSLASTNGVVSGSSQITYANINSIPSGIVSGSVQTIANLPTGTVSGSSQVVSILNSLNTYTGSNDTTNTAQNTRLTTIESVTGSYETKGRGIVSGSSQITFSGISSLPTLVSGSSQVTLSSTTGYGSVLNQAVLSTSSPTFAGGTMTGTITSNVTNNYGLALNRATVSNYNGISLQTAAVAQWYVGMRENLSSNNYIIYNESGTDALTISKSNSNATFAGTITENSSLRYKENVETIKYGLDKVIQMRGVTYNKKDNGVKEVGVIAEEIYDVLPEVVLKNEAGEIDSVSYGRITAVLIEAIKDLKKEIEDLKANR